MCRGVNFLAPFPLATCTACMDAPARIMNPEERQVRFERAIHAPKEHLIDKIANQKMIKELNKERSSSPRSVHSTPTTPSSLVTARRSCVKLFHVRKISVSSVIS